MLLLFFHIVFYVVVVTAADFTAITVSIHGGDGFFFRLQGYWENVRPFNFRLRFFFFFFFEVEIISCTLIPLFMPGSAHSSPGS